MAELPIETDGTITVVQLIARTNVGGASLIVTALMRHLDPMRFQQVLLRGSCEEGETDYLDLRALDVPATSVPGLGRSMKVFGDVQAFWFIFRELRRLRPTIVHTHTAKAGALGRIAALFAGVPVRVHTFHGHVLAGYFGPWTTFTVTLAERILARITTHIVAVGDQTHQDLIAARIAQPARSSMIAPGVQRGDVIDQVDARCHLGLPVDGPVVMFVGRLVPIKRPERFVELARALQSDAPNAVFALAGDGPLRSLLEADAPANVRFLGWQADIPRVMQASDLVVLTSDNEGMPVSLIEAAMHGVATVATDAGTTSRVVLDGQTGYVVPIGDPDALARAVRDLLHDPVLRRSFANRAEKRAVELFSEERLVADHASLYNRLAQRRPVS